MGAMRFFEMTHGVYFDDLDAFQILHNARYVLLIERTIGAFWDQVFGWSGILSPETSPDQSHLVRANHIEYERPVVGVCEGRVRIWIESLCSSCLTLGFRVRPVDEDVNYAGGSRVMVRVDQKSRKAVPWTDGFREKVQPYCLSA
jgi:acyl-CoA thioester hydrolase